MDFPRLFRLVNNKQGLVKIFLNLNGFINVKWGEFFVRPLLEKEEDILKCLTKVVKSMVLEPNKEDR